MALLAPNAETILVVNSGSSSLKLSLFNTSAKGELTLIADALAEELSSPNVQLTYTSAQGVSFKRSLSAFSTANPLKMLLEILAQQEPRFNPQTVSAVGHRVVHGGAYSHSMRIDDKLLETLRKLILLAPLHNPAAIEGIESAMQATKPNTPHIAVFDTAFHRTLPLHARYYGIPFTLTQQHHIERYGFHGIAHKALWEIYATRIAPKHFKPRKIITLHLGNGCSMTAIHEGISQETSMGYTPAEGLLMGTRAGNVDVGAVEALCRLTNQSTQDVLALLNHKSGLLGVSGISSDFRELFKQREHLPQAKLALDLFCHRIRLYLGAYIAILGGVDAILFSGGIGENSPWMRQEVLRGMQWCGIMLDPSQNNNAYQLKPSQIEPLHQKGSQITLYAIGADENRAIAREVQSLFKNK